MSKRVEIHWSCDICGNPMVTGPTAVLSYPEADVTNLAVSGSGRPILNNQEIPIFEMMPKGTKKELCEKCTKYIQGAIDLRLKQFVPPMAAENETP